MAIVRDPQEPDENDWRRLWHGYNAFYKAQIPEAVTASTWKRMLDPKSVIFGRLAVVETAIVGFTISVLHDSTWTAAPVCYLEDLFVDPNYRGRGFGRLLVQDLMDRAKQQGWSRLYWHTRATNPARNLYDEFTAADDFVRYRLIQRPLTIDIRWHNGSAGRQSEGAAAAHGSVCRTFVAIKRRCEIGRHPCAAGPVELMSAGVANSGNAVVGSYPRLSSLSVTLISLFCVCRACLRGLHWVCLGAWFFLLTKPLWQVIQSRLSMTDRCLELSKICTRRSGSRRHSRVRGCFPDCLNDWAHQYRRQQGNHCH
jgi:GNAT superfamily N-acetyltransferase